MGLLRYMLAAAVVWAHAHNSSWLPFLADHVAVTSFFVISGFYMGLVLDTKYGSHTPTFIASRCLRIYPLYFLILLFAASILFGASLWKGQWMDRLAFYEQLWHSGNTLLFAFLAIIQITLVGIDIPCLLYLADNQAHFIPLSGSFDGLLMERFLFLPQAWSIGFEMVFYLTIPFLKPFKTRWLLAILLASLSLKTYFLLLGAPKWDYQFLPSQFGFFLLGFLIYRHRNLLPFARARMLPFLSLLLVIFFAWHWLPQTAANLLWMVTAAAVMPSLFNATKNSPIDNFIGSLSYPLYLVHIPIRWLMLGTQSSHGDSVSPLLFLLISTLAAILLAATFEKWLEHWRANFVKKMLSNSAHP